MPDDDQKLPVDDSPGEPPRRRPWSRPRLVLLDVSSTEQVDDPGIVPIS